MKAPCSDEQGNLVESKGLIFCRHSGMFSGSKVKKKAMHIILTVAFCFSAELVW